MHGLLGVQQIFSTKKLEFFPVLRLIDKRSTKNERKLFFSVDHFKFLKLFLTPLISELVLNDRIEENSFMDR